MIDTNGITLSKHQQNLLLRMYNAETPTVAKEETINDLASQASLQVLTKLGAVVEIEDGYDVSETGIDLLQRHNLLDGNEITDYGNSIISDTDPGSQLEAPPTDVNERYQLIASVNRSCGS